MEVGASGRCRAGSAAARGPSLILLVEGSTKKTDSYPILNTPMTHQGGLADSLGLTAVAAAQVYGKTYNLRLTVVRLFRGLGGSKVSRHQSRA